MNLSEKQLNELIDLLDKEELLETEDKIEKALAKEKEFRSQQNEAKQIAEENLNEIDSKKYLLEDKAEELTSEKPAKAPTKVSKHW